MSGTYSQSGWLKISGVLLLWSLASTVVHAAENPVGEDGLHKPDWLSLSFRDVAEDIDSAAAENKRHVIVYEQKGCIYCTRMHETVLLDPEVINLLKQRYVVVQYNLFGDEEVTDLDGEILTEKTAAEKWKIMFTPTWIFLPESSDGSSSVRDAAVGSMPGAFGKGTFMDLFTWVYEKGYDGDEAFQRYRARRIEERQAAGSSNAD